MYIFRCKTDSGFVFKSLADLLQNNVTNCCLCVSQDGITMRVVDASVKLLLDMNLESKNFTVFEYAASTPLDIGLNTAHLFRMLKSCRKKDAIELRVRENDPSVLDILVIPRESNRLSVSQIKILSWQSLEIDLPSGYKRPVIVATSELLKLVKDLALINDKLTVTSSGGILTFSSSVDKIYQKSIQFGEKSTTHGLESVTDEFENSQLASITKISGLAKTVQIYMHEQLPLFIDVTLSTLGTLGIYLRGARTN